MQHERSKRGKQTRQVKVEFSSNPITSWGGTRFFHINFMDGSTRIFERCFNVFRLPKASTSLTRLWNRFHRQLENEHYLLKASNLKSDSLRLNSTVITRYGEKDGAKQGYNPSLKCRPSNQPQIAFLGYGYTVNFWNRYGNVSSSNGIVGVFHQTLSFIPGIKVERVLADSGYYRKDFIQALEGGEYEYVISAPIIRVLQKTIYVLQDWQCIAPGIEVSEFMFEHSSGSESSKKNEETNSWMSLRNLNF